MNLKSLLLSACVAGIVPMTVQAAGLDGVDFVITNTFQGAQTNNVETDVGAFGLPGNQFATVGDGVELPAYINIYDVDVSDKMIKFTWVETEFSKKITGPTPAGNHDRNYFIFDLPQGMAITEVAFDAENSEMLEGSTVPQATVIAGNRIVIDNNEGVVRGVGFNPAFSVTLSAQ